MCAEATQQRIGRVIQSVAFAVLCVGCGDARHIEHTWTEDVQLENGRVLEVERYVELHQTSALGGGPSSSDEVRASIRIPEERRLPNWEVPLRALVLYYDQATGEWVIVAKAITCNTWQDRGRPPAGYFEFRSNGSWWTPVPLSDKSVGRKTNLLIAYDGDLPDHVTVEDKRQRQSSPYIGKHYLSVNIMPGVFNCAASGVHRQR